MHLLIGGNGERWFRITIYGEPDQNFGRCSLGRTAINWMTKCDEQGEISYKYI